MSLGIYFYNRSLEKNDTRKEITDEYLIYLGYKASQLVTETTLLFTKPRKTDLEALLQTPFQGKPN